MKDYIYSYRDILKAIIKYLCLTTTKSKVINPLYIGTRLNSASFEDTIIGFVDCEKILKRLSGNQLFIILGTIDGYTQRQMAVIQNCTHQNISWHKKRIQNIVRSVQIYDKK